LIALELKKMNNIPILELSVLQLSKLFKNTESPDLLPLAELIKEYSIDGYCLMFLFSDKEKLLFNFESYFGVEEGREIEQIYQIMLPLYFMQI
jgi:hypothetical protein